MTVTEPAAQPATEPVLELRGVEASYGRVTVLFGVDLAVARGETVAVLGSNGAGKSTLLGVASGLRRCDRGDVLLGGRVVTRLPAEARTRLGIVEVVGGAGVFAPLTVLDNLRAGAYRYPRREARARVDRALDLFPVLAPKRPVRAGALSGGQQHLLALALALMHDPDVLLVDELSLGLAPVVVQQVLELLHGLKAGGLTMVVVEQSADLALELADRAVFMEKGAVRFDGPSGELASRRDLLRAAFLRDES